MKLRDCKQGWVRQGVVAATILLALAPRLRSEVSGAGEYELKAAMLLNIARFVEWPAWKMGELHAPFVIGILGPASLATSIEREIGAKSVGSKRVEVKRLSSLTAGTGCQLLFVSRSERKYGASDAELLARTSVLTVGESETFTAEGGAIALLLRDGRVHIQVNLKAAQRSRLTISSRILRLATVVDGGIQR